MCSGLRMLCSLVFLLTIGGAVAACGDDDSTGSNGQTGSDASVYEAGSGGKSSTAGRSGSGGSSAAAGRSAGGATAGNAASAGSGGRPAMTGASGRGASGGNGGANAGVRLSDAQIAAVTTAANSGEIQLGTIALSRARLANVRAFAQEMITMHGAAQDRATALLQSLNITPLENNLSTQLEQEAQRIGVMLQNANAAGFDLAYVQSQVDMHTRVLALIDDTLLPSVTAAALRTDLTLVRGDVQRHLTEAQALLAAVQSAPPDIDAGVEDAGL